MARLPYPDAAAELRPHGGISQMIVLVQECDELVVLPSLQGLVALAEHNALELVLDENIVPAIRLVIDRAVAERANGNSAAITI